MDSAGSKGRKDTHKDSSWACFKMPTNYMKKKTLKKGDVLFNMGDPADKMFYIKKGSLRLVEINKTVSEGAIIGEMGIFSPNQQRTATAVCEKDLEVYMLNKDDVVKLFTQDSAVAVDLMHLSCERFTENIKREVEAKERIKSELRIARDIQMNMLPRRFPPFPERKEFDIFAKMTPAKEVGGDLYDFFFVDDNRLCFLIGDVSGKGVPAALFMAISKALLKTEALHGLSPDEVLKRVNNALAPDNDACMFVTVFCVIIDLDTGNVEFSNGGHNPPLVSKDGEDFEYLSIPKGFVVGAMENMEFKKGTLSLSVGDSIFIYTDGVTEAMNDKGELFSESRLKNSLASLKDKSIEEVVKGVMTDIKNFVCGAPQSDDITILAFKYKGKEE